MTQVEILEMQVKGALTDYLRLRRHIALNPAHGNIDYPTICNGCGAYIAVVGIIGEDGNEVYVKKNNPHAENCIVLECVLADYEAELIEE